MSTAEDIIMDDGGGRMKKPPDPPDPEKDIGTESKTTPIIFEATDEGPFVLFVESKSTVGNGIERMHPMALGNLFKRLHPEIKDKMDRVLKNGKNRIKIIMKDRTSANTLALSEKMKENNFSCYIPRFLVTKQAIIRGVYKDLSDSEILEECEVPFHLRNRMKILSVRRFSRRESDKWVPTETVQLTFRTQVLPEYVTLHYVRCKVEPFIPKVLQCSKCLRYGHSTKFCKSASGRCNMCGEDSHETQDCTKDPPPKCVHCKGEHKSYVDNKKNAVCPEYKKQEEIKKVMTLENKTFSEARIICRQKSYAETSNSQNNTRHYEKQSSEHQQSNSSQSNLFRKRRRNSPPRLDGLQKQRELYDSFSRDSSLPSTPIITNTQTQKSGIQTSHPSSPSLSGQSFFMNEKVRKTTVEPSTSQNNNSDQSVSISLILLSIIKSVINNQEAMALPDNKLLEYIQKEINVKSNSHEFNK